MASAKGKPDPGKEMEKREMDTLGVRQQESFKPPTDPVRKPKPTIAAQKPRVPPKPTTHHSETPPLLDWKDKILINYKFLVKSTDLEKTSDQLFEEEVINEEERELIENVAPNTTYNKNRQLLKILLKKSEASYERFLDSLAEIGHEDIADQIKNTDKIKPRANIGKYPDAKNLRRQVFKNFDFIVKTATLYDLLDDFVSERAFEITDVEEITNVIPNTTECRNRTFLDTLLTRKPYSYELFMDVLDNQDQHQLVLKIKSTVVDSTIDNEIDDYLRNKNRTKDHIPDHVIKLHQKSIKKWEEETVIFCETRGTKSVIDAVNNHPVVTVTGNSGAGKSATIHFVALQLQRKGYSVLPVDKPKEILQYLQPSVKQVFLFDDPVGVHGLDRDMLKKWLFYDDKIETCISFENTKILCSIRRQVYNESDFKNEKCILNRHIVDIQGTQNKLTDIEKMQMITKYLERKKIHIDITPEAKEKLQNIQELYPLLCKLFSSSKEFQGIGWSFFSSPFSVVLNDLDKMQRNAKDKYCVLVLCFASENSLAFDIFDPFCDSKFRLKFDLFLLACGIQNISLLTNAYESLLGVYLRRVGNVLRFSHDVIYDVVAYHFGSKYQRQIIKLCSGKFIRDRIVVAENMISDDNPYVIQLNPRHFPDLIERFVTDLKNGSYNYTMTNNCWRDDEFMKIFMKLCNSSLVPGDVESTNDIIKIFSRGTDEWKEEIENELKQGEESGRISKFSWYNIAMNILQIPKVTALHWAVTFAHRSLFNFIWEHLSTNQKLDVMRLPLLHYACLGSDIEICRILLQEEGRKINYCLPNPSSIKMPLNFAACRSANIVRLLIEYGADVNSDASEVPAIYTASEFGILEAVNVLISSGCNVNKERRYIHQCALHAAAQNNHPDIVTLLLKNNARVDILDTRGNTPLFLACAENNIECARLLLDIKDSNVNYSNDRGRTALMFACEKNSIDCLKLLLEHDNIDLNEQKKNGYTALMFACERNNIESVTLLLSHNRCDLNIKERSGNTALMMACNRNYFRCAQLLLENGSCDVNGQNNDGLTALMFACDINGSECIRLLLDTGHCDTNIKKKDGSTALILASRNGNVSCLKLLLGQNDCEVNIQDNDGLTSLISACHNNNPECVKLLLDHIHCDVNKCNNGGLTPLMAACIKNNVDCAKLLLSHQLCDVTLSEKNGGTALILACYHNNAECVELLLAHEQCNINAQDKNGWSALMQSCKQNNIKCVALLLRRGCDVALTNKREKNALAIAKRKNCSEIIQILNDHSR